MTTTNPFPDDVFEVAVGQNQTALSSLIVQPKPAGPMHQGTYVTRDYGINSIPNDAFRRGEMRYDFLTYEAFGQLLTQLGFDTTSITDGYSDCTFKFRLEPFAWVTKNVRFVRPEPGTGYRDTGMGVEAVIIPFYRIEDTS